MCASDGRAGTICFEEMAGSSRQSDPIHSIADLKLSRPLDSDRCV